MDELVKAIEVYAIDGNQLISTEYTLTIGTGGKTATSEGSSLNATGDIIIDNGDNGAADINLSAALNEQFPDWRTKLTTKSKKWGDNGKAASIVAKITIEPDGGFSVSYSPTKFADYMANGN